MGTTKAVTIARHSTVRVEIAKRGKGSEWNDSRKDHSSPMPARRDTHNPLYMRTGALFDSIFDGETRLKENLCLLLVFSFVAAKSYNLIGKGAGEVGVNRSQG